MQEIITQKQCPRCKEWKPLDKFVKDSRKKYGRGAHCSACKSKANADWVKRNPEKHRGYYKGKPGKPISAERSRENKLRTKYDLSIAEYDEMLRKQNGVCAICGKGNKGRRLAVDHDHKTGKVRKLLCNQCNMAIGNAKEDIGILEKIIEYIKSFT